MADEAADTDSEKNPLLLHSKKTNREKILTLFLKRPPTKSVIIIIIFFTAVVVACFFVVVGVLFKFSLKSPKTFHIQSSIGDSMSQINDEMYLINQSISIVHIKLLKPTISPKVNITSPSRFPPKMYLNSLPPSAIPYLIGPSRYNYNYYGADEPVYLHKLSSLNYELNITSVTNTSESDCPAQLYLFNDLMSYSRFRDDFSFNAVSISPCLTSSHQSWTFLINQTASYYVAIQIGNGWLISSNVSVISAHYNTTGLESSYQLSSTNPSCTLKMCSSFYCQRSNDLFVLARVEGGYVQLNMEYTSAKIQGRGRMAQFVIAVLLVGCLILVIIIAMSLCFVRKVIQK